MRCEPKTIGKIKDIDLPDGYKLIRLIVQEYDRGDYKDWSISGKMVTPNKCLTLENGKPLGVSYDIHMRFRQADYKLTIIDLYWELPEGVWEMVEGKLTEAAKAFESTYRLQKDLKSKSIS